MNGVPTVKNNSSDDVLEFTKSLFKEAKVAVLDNVLDCAHRFRPSYADKITNQKMQKHHCDIYHILTHNYNLEKDARKKLKGGFEVKLNLTKSRFNLLIMSMIMSKK